MTGRAIYAGLGNERLEQQQEIRGFLAGEQPAAASSDAVRNALAVQRLARAL